jgi:hypothetical protein
VFVAHSFKEVIYTFSQITIHCFELFVTYNFSTSFCYSLVNIYGVVNRLIMISPPQLVRKSYSKLF